MNDTKFSPEKLKDCRLNSDLTIDSVIKQLFQVGYDVAPNTLTNWEGGKTSPDATDLAILASFYGKPIQYFFVKNVK